MPKVKPDKAAEEIVKRLKKAKRDVKAAKDWFDGAGLGNRVDLAARIVKAAAKNKAEDTKRKDEWQKIEKQEYNPSRVRKEELGKIEKGLKGLGTLDEDVELKVFLAEAAEFRKQIDLAWQPWAKAQVSELEMAANQARKATREYEFIKETNIGSAVEMVALELLGHYTQTLNRLTDAVDEVMAGLDPGKAGHWDSAQRKRILDKAYQLDAKMKLEIPALRSKLDSLEKKCRDTILRVSAKALLKSEPTENMKQAEELCKKIDTGFRAVNGGWLAVTSVLKLSGVATAATSIINFVKAEIFYAEQLALREYRARVAGHAAKEFAAKYSVDKIKDKLNENPLAVPQMLMQKRITELGLVLGFFDPFIGLLDAFEMPDPTGDGVGVFAKVGKLDWKFSLTGVWGSIKAHITAKVTEYENVRLEKAKTLLEARGKKVELAGPAGSPQPVTDTEIVKAVVKDLCGQIGAKPVAAFVKDLCTEAYSQIRSQVASAVDNAIKEKAQKPVIDIAGFIMDAVLNVLTPLGTKLSKILENADPAQPVTGDDLGALLSGFEDRLKKIGIRPAKPRSDSAGNLVRLFLSDVQGTGEDQYVEVLMENGQRGQLYVQTRKFAPSPDQPGGPKAADYPDADGKGHQVVAVLAEKGDGWEVQIANVVGELGKDKVFKPTRIATGNINANWEKRFFKNSAYYEEGDEKVLGRWYEVFKGHYAFVPKADAPVEWADNSTRFGDPEKPLETVRFPELRDKGSVFSLYADDKVWDRILAAPAM